MNSDVTIKNNTKPTQKMHIISFILIALATNFSVLAHADASSADVALYKFTTSFVNVPNAGTALYKMVPTIKPPVERLIFDLKAPSLTQDASGGEEITVQTISFTGNTQYTNEDLSAILEDAIGETYDLAGLQKLTNLITAHYRSHNFSFARAILPVQSMNDGALVIKIIEGRYGSIKVTGDNKNANRAREFLNKLQTGKIIQGSNLERVALILADQSGFKVTPLLRPGQEVGTGDISVIIERDKGYSGELGLDNHGNRYTGRSTGYLDLKLNSPFLFGDQFKINAMHSDENLSLFKLDYSLPLGGSGLRANVSYAHIYYELGKEFASSQLHGTAKVSSVGISYPIIRSQQTNVTVAGSYQHKVFNDIDNIIPSNNTNSSDILPISFNFNHRDKLVGGGVTYGVVSWTYGNFNIASSRSDIDNITAKTDGGFDKFNLNLARLQILPSNFTLFGRVSAQWTNGNLDSSEKFSLGGVSGVRAYPSSEAFGDEGILAQLEVRYVINMLTPYVFYDIGTINTNHNTWSVGNNKNRLAGAGLGLRFDITHWNLDASAAWRTSGEFSDMNQAETPVIWVGAKYKF